MSYRCDFCKKPVQGVKTCPACNKMLCDDHDKSGFCPEHFAVLSQEDQERLNARVHELDRKSKRMCFLCFIPAGMLVTVIALLSTENYQHVMLLFFCMLISGFLVVCLGIITSAKHMKEKGFFRKELMLKYNIGTVEDEIREKLEQKARKRNKVRICPRCGTENPQNASRCSRCDNTLD